jgi:hypothetical protein
MWWASELLSSMKFLAVTGDERFWKSKRVYEFILPGVLTVLVFFLFCKFPDAFVADFLKSYSNSVFQVMVFVVPFHLAALAALSTTTSVGLDETLSGVNAQLRVWSNQDNGFFWKDLTLRQYASLLFGYLCSIGIIYVLVYLFVSNIDMAKVFGSSYAIAYTTVMFFGIFFVFHYIILTIYAVTFLFDKVNKVRSV